jgi:hypothetical protein
MAEADTAAEVPFAVTGEDRELLQDVFFLHGSKCLLKQHRS